MNEFKLGKKFNKQKYLSMSIVTIVIFAYYIIYDYLFVSKNISSIGGNVMLLLFIVIEIVVMVGIAIFFDLKKKNYYYTIDLEKLIKFDGKSEIRYYWKDFEKVFEDKFTLVSICPITYQVCGKKLSINPYIDNLPQLHKHILDHIEKYVDVSPNLKSYLEGIS